MSERAATLPRKVKTSEAWPAKVITVITDYTTCQHCGNGIAYYIDQYLCGEWVHTDTELAKCAPEVFNIANPLNTCPKCGGPDLVFTAEAWGDRTECPCGYNVFRSISD